MNTKATDGVSTAARELERFSRRQALYAGAGLFAALSSHDPRALVVAGTFSFTALLVARRVPFTSSGRFGAANAVTLLRLLAVFALVVALHGRAAQIWAAALAGALCLDAVDGYLARRFGDDSAFGSHFDMETDAFIVLLVGVELFLRERLGAWVLLGGVLRYAYVLVLWCFPSELGEHPRSSFGRWAFFFLFVGLGAPFVMPGATGTAFAAFGTTLVGVSFGRSFVHWAEGRRRFTGARARAVAVEPRDPPR